jgi:uncharacterized protein DUF955
VPAGMPFTHAWEVIQAATGARRVAGLTKEPYSTKAIVAALYPGSHVQNARLPRRIQEAVRPTIGAEIIIYARRYEPPHQRFVIAHALAHLIFDWDAPGAHVGYAGDAMREARADAFALELLAPLARVHALIDRDMSTSDDSYHEQLDHLSSRFHLPRWAMAKRIRQLAT